VKQRASHDAATLPVHGCSRRPVQKEPENATV
jgi:hypothetical protein